VKFGKCCPGKEAGNFSRLQKRLDKFGQQAHKQAVKAIGKDVASSIPNSSLVLGVEANTL